LDHAQGASNPLTRKPGITVREIYPRRSVKSPRHRRGVWLPQKVGTGIEKGALSIAATLYTLRGHKLRFLYPHPDREGGRDVGNRNVYPHAV